MSLSWPHVHLLLNHFPIIGTLIGLTIFLVGLCLKNSVLKQTSYWTFALIALIALVTYYSGTQAAQAVEELPNVTDAVIHRHKAIAGWGLVGLEIAGALGLLGIWYFRREKGPSWFMPTFLVAAIAATTLMSWAGLHGGTIRHTEVRGDLSPLLLNTEAFEETGDSHSHGESDSHSDGQSAGSSDHSE